MPLTYWYSHSCEDPWLRFFFRWAINYHKWIKVVPLLRFSAAIKGEEKWQASRYLARVRGTMRARQQMTSIASVIKINFQLFASFSIWYLSRYLYIWSGQGLGRWAGGRDECVTAPYLWHKKAGETKPTKNNRRKKTAVEAISLASDDSSRK